MTDETDESRFLQLSSEDSAQKIGYFPEDILNQYKYNSSPRGFALIIRRVFLAMKVRLSNDLYILFLSNENFPVSSSYRPRLGDGVDVDNLTELFEMFGLEVSVLKNVTKGEMLDSLEKFREKFL